MTKKTRLLVFFYELNNSCYNNEGGFRYFFVSKKNKINYLDYKIVINKNVNNYFYEKLLSFCIKKLIFYHNKSIISDSKY